MSARVREARPSDKEPLMAFIKDVWGGHDYIPHVWDEWINDDAAKMFVVEVDGSPVALNRVRFVEDGSAWFEGVRVHPDYRGRGFATLLGENAIRVARKNGVKTFRLTSSSWNYKAHRQIARMKFEETGRVSVYEGKEGAAFVADPEAGLVGTKDLDKVYQRILESAEYSLSGGIMWDGFTAVSLTKEVVGRCVASGSVYQLGGSVAIVRPGREGEQLWTQVSFVCGEPGNAVRLVRHSFATTKGRKWRIVYVPQKSPIIPALRKGGLGRRFSLILYEKKALNG